ncbi:MAG: polyprenyl synthetase family protein [Anaerolineaceae bacterium]|nr:polyprenyl synthetase family protein [Anaerolineaceae bacterium]
MNFDAAIQTIRPILEDYLQACMPRLLEGDHPRLRAMLAYHMGWEGEGAGIEATGKRLRPVLVLLAAQGTGGDWKKALPAAAGVEYLHNFSLIHDDIQDESPRRRGRPTLWLQQGTAQAINAGDSMFTLAHLAMLELEKTVSLSTALECARLLHQSCVRLTRGQYLDLAFEQCQSVSLEDYWNMIGGKTASLLGTCAQLGALVSGADGAVGQELYQFGFNLGLAFQVQDDLLGIWGDPAVTGKSVASDLMAHKKTLPVLYGLQQGGAFPARWQATNITEDEATGLARLLDQAGARQSAVDDAARLTAQALDSLERAVPGCELLQEFAGRLLQRQK